MRKVQLAMPEESEAERPSVEVSWSPSPLGENLAGTASAAATIGAVLSMTTVWAEPEPALPEMSSIVKMAE